MDGRNDIPRPQAMNTLRFKFGTHLLSSVNFAAGQLYFVSPFSSLSFQRVKLFIVAEGEQTSGFLLVVLNSGHNSAWRTTRKQDSFLSTQSHYLAPSINDAVHVWSSTQISTSLDSYGASYYVDMFGGFIVSNYQLASTLFIAPPKSLQLKR